MKRSILSACCASALILAGLTGCSTDSQPKETSTPTKAVGEIRLQIDTENSSVDEHLRAALRNLNDQFTAPFPNDEYLPRTADELEAGSSSWVYDGEATQGLNGEDLVFKIKEGESIQYSTASEYNNLTLRWYCSWMQPLTDAIKQADTNELTQLRTRIEKDDPARSASTLAASVDPSVAAYAKVLREASNEADFSTLSTMCSPLKIKR